MRIIPGNPLLNPRFLESSTKVIVRSLGVLLILMIFVFLAACASGGDETQKDENDPVEISTEDDDPVSSEGQVQSEELAQDEQPSEQSSATEIEEIQAAPISPDEGWQTSAHSDSYVLSSNGTNDTCARCHSPAEWLPGPEDIPESCLTCKFDVDTPDPVISEDHWGHVPCKTCHKVKDGEVNPEYVWLDIAVIDEYIDVDSPSELCGKCHEESEQPDHKPAISLSEDHQDLECTGCHDPHSTEITCSDSDCHPDLFNSAEPVIGHDEDHSIVSCLACHDAGNLQIGPEEESGDWVTFIEVSRDGEEGLIPHSSHNIQLEVPCERCHFPDNPWGLSGEVSSAP